ncbi:MAG: D-aminoacylase [Candidatus Helarchaeota archaeon]|nr:D-aminoacylase [Candidatus Helarchaeota archaeon]
MKMNKFLIKNGKIVDGSGNPWFKADISLVDKKIKEIAPKIEETNFDEVIDASGLIVAPGFIDIHTHSDLTILAGAENVLTQGVTTHVIGNCGFSLTPMDPEILQSSTLAEMLATILGVKDYNLQYHNVTEFFTDLERQGITVNAIPLVGHSMLRIEAMGLSRKVPTPEELEIMKASLADELERGAFGMSTGLDYPPGSFAKPNEIIELCKVVKEFDGIYTTHFRGFASGLVRATKEAIKITEGSGVSTQISHFKPFGFWFGDIKRAYRRVEQAREKGLEITFDVFPHASNHTFLFAMVPPWLYLSKEKLDLNKAIATLKQSRSDPELQARIYGEMDQIGSSFLKIKTLEDWKKVYISAPGNEEYNGKTAYQIGVEKHIDPKEAIISVLIDQNGQASGTYLSMTEEENLITITHPLSMFASDGRIIPEDSDLFPNPYCNGTFTQVLGKYVRELHVLTLPEAIRKMTSFPAQKLGLKGRGLIKEDYWGDITIFDPKRIADRATYENPRLYSEGVEYVFVNGQLALKQGAFTRVKSGTPLLKL